MVGGRDMEKDAFNISMPQNKETQNRHLYVILGAIAAAVIILISVILGTVLGTRNSSSKSSDCFVQSASPSIAQGSASQYTFRDESFKLKFLVIGDWGRQGEYNQSALGVKMAEFASGFKPEFVISTGDNFYESGLSSDTDPLFTKSYLDIYSGEGLLGVPWYSVLGNHDYGDGREDEDENINCKGVALEECQGVCCNSPVWQLGMKYKRVDDRWNCQRFYDMSLAGGQVYILFIDTTPFVDKYRNDAFADNPYGINSQCSECQLREIEYRLSVSDAPWKIVVGHHPVFSNGHHFNTTELVDLLEPLLRQYKVQVYFNGHEHDLEHVYFENDVTP
eukprot:TRINITY_DN4810_c0_g1_i5.p1 TRINITY_DN4810_c0_g1~~TRINITY_DN4810_c0_g1_i5.p1  ORF type:complete len:335 (-),score=20.22 TRINITY_DN4810_c0_g1_i5:19-1023(-)